MPSYTVFVCDPEVVPECQPAVAIARQHEIPVRKIEANSIDQIQAQFGDAFPGVPALYAEGENPPFSVGMSAIVKKLSGSAPAVQNNELPPIPAKDKPDGAVRD